MRHPDLWRIEKVELEAMNGGVRLDVLSSSESSVGARWSRRVLNLKEALALQAMLAKEIVEAEQQ